MSRIRVTCVHCEQLMEVRSEDTNRELRCVRCGKTFRLPPDSHVKSGTGKDVQGVIAVLCQECGDTFGIRKSMQGKLVACPNCEAVQMTDPGVSPETGEPSKPAAKPRERTRKKPDSAASERRESGKAKSKSSTSLATLLPPRYTVPPEIEAEVMEEFSPAGAKGISLGIDTERTRIRHKGAAVDVASLSREEKSRRKRIRVGVVYGISILILVVLFLILMQQIGPGE